MLTVGFVYEFGSGALYFTDKRSSIAPINKPKSPFSTDNKFARSYSTSTKDSSYLKDVYETDEGQDTKNVNIIARRHIVNGAFTDVSIINKVLKISITQEKLDILTNVIPQKFILSNNIVQSRCDLQIIVGKGRSGIPDTKRIAGVYVFTNVVTGDQLVGSSINLAVRLISYLTPKNQAFGSRLIFDNFRKFVPTNYEITIYVIRDGYNTNEKEVLQKETLALEQYFIFTLNTTLNTIKVAGAAPFESYTTPKRVEQIKKTSKQSSIPAYVYKDNVLIYHTSSQKQLKLDSGISNNTQFNALSGSLIFGVFQISTTFIESCSVDILSPFQFKKLVSEMRLAFRRTQMNAVVPKRDEYLESWKIQVTATNNTTGRNYRATSITEISKLLRELGPKEYVSPSTISVCLRNNKPSKYWQFSRTLK